MAIKSDILIARLSYFVVIDGERYSIHRGKTTAHANHPVVRGNEDKWRSILVDYAVKEKPEPEPAKAEPAKKAVPAKKAAPKKQAESKPDEKESV